MLNPAKKATCHTFLCALAFASLASGQVVERGRTFADLTASHPCDTGLTNRIARVTDCDAAGTIGDGGGAFQCWAYCDGSAPWADVAIGGSAGGGAATAVEGSATLPATCTEKDLYQDTDSGGTEFYVCTATNTWTKTGTGAGDVVGPASATDNAIVRFDATTGKLVQTSNLTCSDVSGVTTTLATITPAATTGASVAGQALAITASPAVASTDTAGAAAGGSVTITAGAAARNTSGNANGGSISFMPGAGIGTGVSGNVGVGVTDPSRTFAVNGRAVIGDGNIGNLDKQGILDIFLDSSLVTGLSSPTRWNSIVLGYVNSFSDSLALGIINGVGPFLEAHSGNPLTIITGNSEFATFGSDHILTLAGWENTYGKNALTADYTNATATMSNLTALSTTLVAARKYTFRMVLRFSDSVAGEGAKFDFDGGSATATDFGVNCQMFDSALLLSSDSTALATDFAVATATGASKLVCDGSFTVNAAGTFIPRAAQNSHSTGTLTVELGSHLLMNDVSFN